LKKKEEAVAIAKSEDDEEDFDDMPFLPRKKTQDKPEQSNSTSMITDILRPPREQP